MGKYSDSPKWEDIIPIPQDDGGPNPLAVITYTEDYSEAMSYLRAVMAKDEKSDRVLGLTEDIIKKNPAHYTVWLYRADNLFTLRKDLSEELEWLNKVSLKHLKNYQIWHHRQTVMSQMDTLPSTELAFLDRMFSKDAKNYHVWSYRQWLVRRFALWDDELPYIDALLQDDVRNNSAWNHRWFVVFGRYSDTPKQGSVLTSSATKPDPAVLDGEVSYAEEKIALAPQNQSPWNYLRGVLKKRPGGLKEVRAFAEQFADVRNEHHVKSSHALDILADIYAQEQRTEESGMALQLLATKYDPIRKNYWNYRRGLVGLAPVQG